MARMYTAMSAIVWPILLGAMATTSFAQVQLQQQGQQLQPGNTVQPANQPQGQNQPPLTFHVPVHIQDLSSNYDGFFVRCVVWSRFGKTTPDMVSEEYDLTEGAFDGTVIVTGYQGRFPHNWRCKLKLRHTDRTPFIAMDESEKAPSPPPTFTVEGTFE